MNASPITYLLVHSNPVEGREDEYNEWYNTVHIPEILGVPGFVAAQRYVLSDKQRDGIELPRHTYLAIYELTIEPEEAFAVLGQRTPTRSDAIDQDSLAYYWTKITPRFEANE